jgi:hypothetical protein
LFAVERGKTTANGKQRNQPGKGDGHIATTLPSLRRVVLKK